MSIEQANAALAGPGSPLELVDGEVGGVSMKVYKNAPPTVTSILMLAEQQFGARDYIVYEDERVTYRAMALAVKRLAAEMRDVYDIQKGDRIAVIMRNYPQWPVALVCRALAGRHCHTDEFLVDRRGTRIWSVLRRCENGHYR